MGILFAARINSAFAIASCEMDNAAVTLIIFPFIPLPSIAIAVILMLNEIIRKHVLKNAYEHGVPNEKAIVGKVIAEYPEGRKEMGLVMDGIRTAISEVAGLSKEDIGEKLKAYSFAEKKAEGERKFRIENAQEGKVVTRFLPEPNGFLHIGHAKAAFLSSELARQYGGKCILRFDDTNPDAESQEYVDSIRQSLEWLGLSFAAENFTSDKMAQLQNFGSKMVLLGKAYVCSCSQETIKKKRFDKIPCSCRDRKGGENFHLWERMLRGDVAQGEAILRFKGGMASENTVMRDPTLFRIIRTPHFRQGKKYAAWPTYDFEVSISDSLDGVTHALRSKEYELRDELYYAILDAVNLRKPVVYDFSRLSMKGTLLSKRFLKPLIDKKKVMGWDDPRLPTLDGLRRRGVLPAAIKEFVLRQGLSKVESEPEFVDLLAINRRLLDQSAPHYFFIKDPMKLKVLGLAPEYDGKNIAIGTHVGDSKRTFAIGAEFLITKADASALAEGETIRLKDLFNIKVMKIQKGAISCEYAGNDSLPGGRKIQWLPSDEVQIAKCEVIEAGALLDSKGEFNEEGLNIAKGVCEASCQYLPLQSIVQFERYGFCRLDEKKKGRLVFIFSC